MFGKHAFSLNLPGSEGAWEQRDIAGALRGGFLSSSTVPARMPVL
jgi:hypothetical protein